MPEPSVDAVLSGFDTTLDEPAVRNVIDDAGVLLRQAYDDGELADETDTTIWKYLVRHLIRFEPDRQETSKQLGSASVSYSGDFGSKLHATSPGQTALQLDPDGRLEDLGPNEDLFFRSV